MDIIRLEQVRKSFDNRQVLCGIDLAVKEGEFLTVIGRSGCGKTTMLKTINGLHRPDSGSVFVEGQDLSKTDIIKLRRKIGYVIQNRGLFPHMTVETNITYVPVISGKKNKSENRNLALRLLKTVGLTEDMLDRYPSQLSGGQQQRVGIARALAADAKIMLMDEPFGAIDSITRTRLQDELLTLHRGMGKTCLFVTHDIEEAFKMGTKVVIMDQGKLLQYGTPEEIILHPADGFVSSLVESARAKEEFWNRYT